MKHTIRIISILAVVAFLFASCDNKPKYVIGVSQCSDDSWRTKLHMELQLATYFNEGVQIRYASAHDDSNLQKHQIDSLVNSGIDLLIVSPNQADLLVDAIDKAYDKGIPVILFDRKSNSSKYNAFMGADNYHIGSILAHYMAGKLGGSGNIVEIGGLKGSSPAVERHEGFANTLKKYPDIHIVAYQSGDWTEASGEIAMRNILRQYDGKIDAIYGGNDRMVVGARRVLKESGKATPHTLYVGIDALPDNDGGMRQVADSVLTASAIYPTHGDELVELALKILNGEDYNKETMMKTSIVTSDNASVLMLQHEEVKRQLQNLSKMNDQATNLRTTIQSRETAIGLVLLFALIASIALCYSIRAYRLKRDLNAQLQQQNEILEEQQNQLCSNNSELYDLNAQLQKEKEKAERQRDELEEQRDKLIEISLHQQSEQSETADADGIITGGEHQYRRESEFMQKFNQIVDKYLDNADLSVEDIGSEMCLSRVQLYRKVKALTGKSPVEIVRETRLQRGHHLLADSSLNISEIAYRVGFSSPSYFTKCYKDYFGKAPTEVQKM